MATVEELLQMTNMLQGQQHALNQEILRLTAENLQCRNAGNLQYSLEWPRKTTGFLIAAYGSALRPVLE